MSEALLNTLHLMQPRALMTKEDEALAIHVEGKPKTKIPVHHLVSVVCWGGVSVTPPAMRHCADNGVSVVFLSAGSGRFVARVEGPLGRTATLRRAQYAASDRAAEALAIARSLVAAKVANSGANVARLVREERTVAVDETRRAQARLQTLKKLALAQSDLDSVRGVEGEAAKRYFEAMGASLRPTDFVFEKRTRRPPRDPVNALLSLAYALLLNDCVSALEAAGLDPMVGFLHVERSGRPALALDVMEPLRPVVADRFVFAFLRRKQVKLGDFEQGPSGAFSLKDAARRRFIAAYQERKRGTLVYPGLARQLSWAEVPHVQALLLARALRHEGEFIPFVWK